MNDKVESGDEVVGGSFHSFFGFERLDDENKGERFWVWGRKARMMFFWRREIHRQDRNPCRKFMVQGPSFPLLEKERERKHDNHFGFKYK